MKEHGLDHTTITTVTDEAILKKKQKERTAHMDVASSPGLCILRYEGLGDEASIEGALICTYKYCM